MNDSNSIKKMSMNELAATSSEISEPHDSITKYMNGLPDREYLSGNGSVSKHENVRQSSNNGITLSANTTKATETWTN
jgi:hypothetical protein